MVLSSNQFHVGKEKNTSKNTVKNNNKNTLQYPVEMLNALIYWSDFRQYSLSRQKVYIYASLQSISWKQSFGQSRVRCRRHEKNDLYLKTAPGMEKGIKRPLLQICCSLAVDSFPQRVLKTPQLRIQVCFSSGNIKQNHDQLLKSF